MNRGLQLLLAGSLAFVATGCGTVRPSLGVSKPGISDIEGEREIADRYAKAIADSIVVPKEEVVVLVSSLPEGLRLDGSTLQVEAGYEHRIIASFDMRPSFAGLPLVFLDYRSGWRKGLCHPQVPITWITFGLWPTISPTAWACWGGIAQDKLDMVQDVRLLGASAGGDTVIVQFVEMPGSSGDVVAARGFVLTADPRVRASNFEQRTDIPVAAPKDI